MQLFVLWLIDFMIVFNKQSILIDIAKIFTSIYCSLIVADVIVSKQRKESYERGKEQRKSGTVPPFSESGMCKWTAHVSFQYGGREGGRREGISLYRRLMGKAEMKTHSATVYDLISHSEHRQPSDALTRSSESLRLFF